VTETLFLFSNSEEYKPMPFMQIIILAVLQGACELLPVSSSAHVIIAEKLMGIDPTTPEMTLLLVMLHTGTMFAVILYFRSSWKEAYFRSAESFKAVAASVVAATLLTGIVGLLLKVLIEKAALARVPNAEVEMIFGNLYLISASLAVVGVLIIASGRGERRRGGGDRVRLKPSLWVGAVQGLCLPFRGFSRSGATISTGLLLGVSKRSIEEFSFALAVVLTPPVILRELHRLLKAQSVAELRVSGLFHLLLPGMIGMIASFAAGLLALKWLSRWLERGRWKFFGYYCLAVSVFAFFLHSMGY
jgi:undecaprenyl-diphosphatase